MAVQVVDEGVVVGVAWSDDPFRWGRQRWRRQPRQQLAVRLVFRCAAVPQHTWARDLDGDLPTRSGHDDAEQFLDVEQAQRRCDVERERREGLPDGGRCQEESALFAGGRPAVWSRWTYSWKL